MSATSGKVVQMNEMYSGRKANWTSIWGEEHFNSTVVCIYQAGDEMMALLEENGSFKTVSVLRVKLLEDAE